MRPERRTVDVIMERIPLASRWASERWQPAAVEMPATAVEDRDAIPGTGPAFEVDDTGNRWRCPGFDIELHPTEAEGYFLNITAPDPRIFVMWRHFEAAVPSARPVLVTVSYNQAGRLMDGGEQVDGVPMLPQIASWVRAFVAAHYKPEAKRKVRRNDPLGEDAARDRRRKESG